MKAVHLIYEILSEASYLHAHEHPARHNIQRIGKELYSSYCPNNSFNSFADFFERKATTSEPAASASRLNVMGVVARVIVSSEHLYVCSPYAHDARYCADMRALKARYGPCSMWSSR